MRMDRLSSNEINTMNDMEAMMKKSDEEEEEDDEGEEEENCSTSLSRENATRCFQSVADGATATSKALLDKSLSHTTAHNGTQQTHQHNTIHSQLKRNYACICIFAFLVGTDFAVIIPTLWDRLNIDYEASGAFMGLVLSSYSLSGVICGLIMGKISDEINKTKVLLFISILFGIVGHMFYFVGLNKWIILLGRVISGLCLGASTVLLAYIAKTSNEQQRTSVISVVMASRQIGLMLAPAFNLFLRKFNFYLFDYILVDRKSSPGAFMALLWSLSLVLISVLYKEFYPISYLNGDSSQPNSSQLDVSSQEQKFSRKNKNIYKKEFVRIEIFILLGVTFFTYFNQTSLETIVIPFTEIMFGWSELENSILFCIGGVVIIASYVAIRMLSKRLTDRWIMLIGLITIATGLIIACACLPFAPQFSSSNVRTFIRRAREEAAEKRSFKKWQTSFVPDEDDSDDLNEALTLNFTRPPLISGFNSSNVQMNSTSMYHDYQLFPAFAVFVAFDVLGLPAIAICSASLFTKLIDNKVQGIGQGIQRGVLGVGTIFGPLLAGPLIYKPVILLAITLSFILVILFLLLLFFKHFRVATTVDNQSSSSNHGNKPLKT